MRNLEIDVAIIGAGPAGLASATACKTRGLNFKIFDQGGNLEIRNRNDPHTAVRGIGGAGLFSDGKLSFFPSSTKLWSLAPRTNLEQSYSWFAELISITGREIPPFDTTDIENSNKFIKNIEGEVFEKKYLSIKLDSNEREQLIEKLRDECRDDLLMDTKISYLNLKNEGVEILADFNNEQYKINAAAVIFAGGRMGPLLLCQHLPQSEITFDRLEIGLRIEQPSKTFFLRDHEQVDPKIIWRDTADENIEWRTFCCCREGEVITGKDSDLTIVSGTSDSKSKEFSNVGLTVRIESEILAKKVYSGLFNRIRKLEDPVVEKMGVFISQLDDDSRLKKVYGKEISSYLVSGLNKLVGLFPGFDSANTTLYGPAVEGVGYYPVLNDNLKNVRFPIWVAGDATGLFRGLTAALVSGYFTGLMIKK